MATIIPIRNHVQHWTRLRRLWCCLFHSRRKIMFAGGSYYECYCGVRWPCPWDNWKPGA